MSFFEFQKFFLVHFPLFNNRTKEDGWLNSIIKDSARHKIPLKKQRAFYLSHKKNINCHYKKKITKFY